MLVCWAVDKKSTTQVSWNYLKGKATVVGPDGEFEYPSWNFAANMKCNKPLGIPGTLDLNGLNGGYDAPPDHLLFDLPAGLQSEGVTIITASQDFRPSGQNFKAKASFKYDDDKWFPFHYCCVSNWDQCSVYLEGDKFNVTGEKSFCCYKSTKNHLLAVLRAEDKQGETYGIIPQGVGFLAGKIYWQPK